MVNVLANNVDFMIIIYRSTNMLIFRMIMKACQEEEWGAWVV